MADGNGRALERVVASVVTAVLLLAISALVAKVNELDHRLNAAEVTIGRMDERVGIANATLTRIESKLERSP